MGPLLFLIYINDLDDNITSNVLQFADDPKLFSKVNTDGDETKVSEQCGIAASKGNQIIGLIRRNITYKGKKLITPLYKAIVRPHVEYCIKAWRPYRRYA